jgi:LysM repeat protein
MESGRAEIHLDYNPCLEYSETKSNQYLNHRTRYMKRTEIFLITFIFLFLYCFRFNAVADSKINPFTIDPNTKRIVERYMVQKGDTLSEISDRYSVSIQKLSKYNHLKSQMVYIGQKLLIPLKPANRRAMGNEKESVQEIMRQGDEYRSQKQHGKAIEYYRTAINSDPNNIDAYYGVGHSNLKMGLHQKAIESFIKAVRVDPYNPESHYNLGLVYVLITEKEAAFEQYKILKILNGSYATRLLMYVDSLR